MLVAITLGTIVVVGGFLALVAKDNGAEIRRSENGGSLLTVADGHTSPDRGITQPVDGIYLLAPGDTAVQMRTQDGSDVSLGARQVLKIQRREVTSRNNANDRFYVHLTIPYDERLGAASYVLVVAGTAYQQRSSGSFQKETSSLGFDVAGEANARRVADFLKATVAYRRHPQHNLRVSFIPAKQEFGVGEPVNVTLQITNVGANRVIFGKGGRNRAPRDNQYVFSARYQGKQVDDIGISGHFGGLGYGHLLKPGDVFTDTVSLSKWFAFDKPGIYEVHGSYYLDFFDPESNIGMTIWEDYVTADFMVRIEPSKEASNKALEDTARRPAEPQR